MTKENLKSGILTTIEERRKITKRTTMTFQVLLLLSVMTSFLTAAIAGINNVDKSIVAMLAGLSGLIVVIAMRFSFTQKITWNELYRANLQALLIELNVVDPMLIEVKYKSLKEIKQRQWATKQFESSFLDLP